MKRFANLFAAIDATNATNVKVDAMARYFATAPPADAAWAVFFLTGRRLKRLIPGRSIGDWTMAATGLSQWLLDECYAVVGDGAETAALILDQLPAVPVLSGPAAPAGSTPAADITLADWMDSRVLPLAHAAPERQRQHVISWLADLDRWQRFTLLKILSGEFRVGVSHTLVVRALAQAASLPPATIAARLMGEWMPSADWYASVIAADVTDVDRSRPYPFFLASPLDNAVQSGEDVERLLGPRGEWQAEWKWDGIRAQLVRRGGNTWLWSRGEELVTERFPEITDAAAALPDGIVLDGEVLAFRSGRPVPFSALQQRIGRRLDVAKKARAVPVVFMAYDLLEHEGIDIRPQPLATRRAVLDTVIAAAQPLMRAARTASSLLPFEDDAPLMPADAPLQTSAILDAATWSELAIVRRRSRDEGVEGLMLKRLTSAYGVGRKRADWWKWKIAPHTIDAVLIYAQPGSGKRASLLTDYTFGVWSEGELVPVAKAYSGLTNEEIDELDRWIRRHTVERFGPVRHVEPVHVFELGFENIARSSRHRSGVAVRFPRMLRWRRDKRAAEADTLDTLLALVRT